LERLKKPRGAGGSNDDDDSDDDSDDDAPNGGQKPVVPPKERFPGGGQTLKASRTGSGGLLFGSGSAHAAGTSSGVDSVSSSEASRNSTRGDKEATETKKPYEPFAGPGRTLR
jgi:hypothetical protein